MSVGLIGGRAVLSKLETSLLSQSSFLYLMIRYPAGSFFEINTALSSDDPAVRVMGYYGAQEHGLATKSFLMDRFDKEDNLMVRKTIVSILRSVSPDDYTRLIGKYPELVQKPGKMINHPPFVW